MTTSPVHGPSSSRGRKPLRRSIASAPMRVSFAGGGSDLPPFLPGVGGRVVGTAIDVRVRAAVEPFDAGWIRLDVPALGRTLTRRRSDPAASDHDFRLLEAALARAGVEDGARVEVATDVVPGSGLGGSASVAVSIFAALYTSLDEPVTPEAIAHDAMLIERDGLGILGGKQDQMFAACGGFLDLRFDERGCHERRALTPPPALVRELAAGLLLVDTQVRRVSGDVIRRIDRGARLGTTAELVAAAADVADALESGSLEGVLEGMRRSARAKLMRDPEGNRLAVELERELTGLGVEVIRLCGAGGGGHALVWAREPKHRAILDALGPSRVRKPVIAAPGVRIEPEEAASRRSAALSLVP